MIRTFELDADDKATLLAALLHKLGHPYRVVMGLDRSSLKIQTCDGGAWVDVEW